MLTDSKMKTVFSLFSIVGLLLITMCSETRSNCPPNMTMQGCGCIQRCNQGHLGQSACGMACKRDLSLSCRCKQGYLLNGSCCVLKKDCPPPPK